mgnify:CR=1 FL=1
MTKPEIMNCAAILAAGIMANESPRTMYDAELAVDLMMQIAKDISQRTAEPERKYRELR